MKDCNLIYKYRLWALFYSDLMPFLIYRDKMRAKGPNHYPIYLEWH